MVMMITSISSPTFFHGFNPCVFFVGAGIPRVDLSLKLPSPSGKRNPKTRPLGPGCEINYRLTYRAKIELKKALIEVKSGLRLKTLRTSIFFCLFTYDTSFLKRKQVVVNGDVESNPGPTTSIESYRAAIGRYSGRAKYISKKSNMQKVPWTDMLILFLVVLLLVILYATVIALMYSCFYYFMTLCFLTLMYGYSYLILYQGSELMSMSLHKIVKRNELKRKPSLPKGFKVATLIPCNYLDTLVLDGRCKRKCISKCKCICTCNYLDTSVLDGRVGKSFKQLNHIDNERIYKMVVSTASYIMSFTVIVFCLNFNYQFFCTNNKVDLCKHFVDNSSNTANNINDIEFHHLYHQNVLQILLTILCCFNFSYTLFSLKNKAYGISCRHHIKNNLE